MLSKQRRLVLAAATGAAASPLFAPLAALAQNMPGVTANEIRIGSTTSFSGPVSALGTTQRAQAAYFKMINEQGGIAGRKINYIVYDDGFNPAKTLEQTRRLVERDEVAFMFGQLGTGPNSAVVKYLNQLGIPHLFLAVNGDKWGDYKSYPWTMGLAPSARIEAQIFAKYALAQNPKAKIALLYQNDDLGRDYVLGLQGLLGDRYDAIVKAVSYEVTDPSIDSQLIELQSSGAGMLISGVTGKFGAMSIRRVFDLGWKPTHFIASGVASIPGTIIPAGKEESKGVICTSYLKDPADPAMADDAGIVAYKAFMGKYYPEGNVTESYNNYGYMSAMVMRIVLDQCKGDFSRRNIMLQANSLKDVQLPTMLPGILVNTSPTNHHPIRQVQFQRWDGKGWQRFGEVIADAGA